MKKTEVLTAQEKKISKYVAMGFIAKEIADKLCISVHTAKTHIKNIRKKTGARNIADITRMYLLSFPNVAEAVKVILFFLIQLHVIFYAPDTEQRRTKTMKIQNQIVRVKTKTK